MTQGTGALLGVRVCVCLGGAVLAACTSMNATQQGSRPFFEAQPPDIHRYQSLARKRESQFETCVEDRSCAYVHFTRALVALFEDRGLARDHFNRVMDFAPDSALALSSKLWVKLIEDQSPRNPWNQVLDAVRVPGERDELQATSTQQLVRDLLDREILIDQLLQKRKTDSVSLRALQREVSQRDREIHRLTRQQKTLRSRTPSIEQLERELAMRKERIAELNSQLEALKRIDQELREKTRPVNPLPAPMPPKSENTHN